MKAGQALGKYKLESLLGEGGGGRVFRAIQQGPAGFSRHVAIKVLSPAKQSSEQATKFFSREARIVARLQHRNIVQIYDFDCQEDIYFLVTELIEGITARELVRYSKSKLPLWLGLAISFEVCQALEYAHQLRDAQGQALGIIHRDIKPSNILLSTQGQVKLADFGLAKMTFMSGDENTAHGLVRGTPAYMSPEQQLGKPATAASDIYSLAKVVLELITGIYPQDNEEIPSLPSPVLDAEQDSKSIPPQLEQGLIQALSWEPATRPTSQELGELLADALPRVTPPEHLAHLSVELASWVCRLRQHLLQLELPSSTDISSSYPVKKNDPFAPHLVAADDASRSQVIIELPDDWPVMKPNTATERLELAGDEMDTQVMDQPDQGHSSSTWSSNMIHDLGPCDTTGADESTSRRGKDGVNHAPGAPDSRSLSHPMTNDRAFATLPTVIKNLSDYSVDQAKYDEQKTPRLAGDPAEDVHHERSAARKSQEDRQRWAAGAESVELVGIIKARRAKLLFGAFCVMGLVFGLVFFSLCRDKEEQEIALATLQPSQPLTDAGSFHDQRARPDASTGASQQLMAIAASDPDAQVVTLHQPTTVNLTETVNTPRVDKIPRARTSRKTKSRRWNQGKPSRQGLRKKAVVSDPLLTGASENHNKSPVGTSYLSVNSEPWATIFLDEKSIGTTPLYRLRVPAGMHQLRLVNPGGQSAKRIINLRNKEHRNLGLIYLK